MVRSRARRAARALGLHDGPVHAELRLDRDDAGRDRAFMIEIAARSIGGLCSRTLSFGTGMSLEEIILRHALGMPIASLERDRRAAGVMMIPIPGAGVLEEVEGLDAARAVPLVEDVVIALHKGQEARAAARGLALSRLHLLAGGDARGGRGGPAPGPSPPALRHPLSGGPDPTTQTLGSAAAKPWRSSTARLVHGL